MAYKIINKCPVCDSKLYITRLQCSKCKTVIENTFELSTKFEYLNPEQLSFVVAFLKNRGNIKDVEKELGISYPTVRAKLDDVLKSLGFDVNPTPNVDKKKIVDMLDKGEITPDQAIKMLNE